MNKIQVIATRLDEKYTKQLIALCELENRTKSYIARELIQDKLDEINSGISSSKGSRTNLNIKHD